MAAAFPSVGEAFALKPTLNSLNKNWQLRKMINTHQVKSIIESPVASKKHLYSLDLLRGFAALSVCLLHYTFGLLPNLRDTPLTPLFTWGYLGVEVFFIISGFIIPYALDKSKYHIREFAPFIGKRIVRICPPSYFAILAIVGQRLFLDFVVNHNRTYTKELSWYQVFDNIFYTVPYTSGSWFNGVFWTLAVEFQYYIIIGLCFWFVKRGLWQVFALALVCNLIHYSTLLSKVQFFEFNSLFIFGIVIWLKYSDRINRKQFWFSSLAVLGLIYYQINYLAAIFSLATMLCILFFNIKSKIFSFFGKISYSLYLLHNVVGTTVEAFWIKVFPVVSLFEKILLLSGCLTVAIIAAYVFHLIIEVPFMKMAEHLFRKNSQLV